MIYPLSGHINIIFFLQFSLLLGLKAEFRDKRIKISTELYRKGCVETAEEGLKAAQKIGFPVMIKASEGGGGKGIRKAECNEEFPNLFRQVCEKTNEARIPGWSVRFRKHIESIY